MAKRGRSFLFAILGMLMSITALTGCDGDSSGPLRLGTNVWLGYEPAYLARDLGYFDEGEVELTRFHSATDVIQAFRNEAIDVAALTLDEAMLLVQDGFDIQVFFVTDVSQGADVILTMADSGITGIADLAGRTIGVESSALGAYVLARAVQLNGIPLDSVNTAYVTADGSKAALLSGEVDAVATFDPYRSHLLEVGAVEIFSSREMPNEIVDVLVTRTAYSERNPAALRMLTRAWLKAVDFFMQEPGRASVMIGKRFQILPNEVSVAYEGLILPDATTVLGLLSGGDASPLAQNAERLSKVLVDFKLWSKAPQLEGRFTDAYVE